MVWSLVTKLMVLIAYGALLVAPYVSTKSIDSYAPLLPPEPEPGYYKHLDECVEGVPSVCGLEYNKVLIGSQKLLSDLCCQKLVEKGKKCHDVVIKMAISILSKDSHLPKPEEMYKTSSRTWNYCASVTRGKFTIAPAY